MFYCLQCCAFCRCHRDSSLNCLHSQTTSAHSLSGSFHPSQLIQSDLNKPTVLHLSDFTIGKSFLWCQCFHGHKVYIYVLRGGFPKYIIVNLLWTVQIQESRKPPSQVFSDLLVVSQSSVDQQILTVPENGIAVI